MIVMVVYIEAAAFFYIHIDIFIILIIQIRRLFSELPDVFLEFDFLVILEFQGLEFFAEQKKLEFAQHGKYWDFL